MNNSKLAAYILIFMVLIAMALSGNQELEEGASENLFVYIPVNGETNTITQLSPETSTEID